jgi:hypothetical protein
MSPPCSSFKVARQTYNTPTSRSFSANCEKYMRKGARLRVTKSRTSPAATSHNQCTFRDNAVTGKARTCRESRTQVSWWQPGYLGCYSAGNKHRFGITRAGQPKTSLCMRNSHWIGSNQCHCHNAFGAWAGRKYTGMLYVWVMPAPPRRRVIAARRKAIRRKTRKPLRRIVRKKKRSTRGAARAAHRARIARMRAKHAAFKGKVTGAGPPVGGGLFFFFFFFFFFFNSFSFIFFSVILFLINMNIFSNFYPPRLHLQVRDPGDPAPDQVVHRDLS